MARERQQRGGAIFQSSMPTRKTERKGKKVVTPAVKRELQKARRDLTAGKGVSVGELLTKVLERDARKHAA